MLTIQNGKFYKDGKVMPVEFGNKEQAEVFEKASKYEKALKTDGLMLDYTETTTFSANFKCFCGQFIFIDGSSDFDDIEVLANDVHKCSCKKHRFETYMENGALMVKEVKA